MACFFVIPMNTEIRLSSKGSLMIVWLMPAYILSGVALVIVGYQSYITKPFCFQNQAIRNESIRLHRIKVRQFDLGSTEQLTPDEEQQYDVFKRADKKYLFIDQMVKLFVAVHLICLMILMVPPSHWGDTMPLYYASGLLIFIGKPVLTSTGNYRQPLCVTTQSIHELYIIESFYKQINGIPLTEEEKKYIDNYESEIRWNGYHMKVLYIGIVLHIIATILHSIVYMFQT